MLISVNSTYMGILWTVLRNHLLPEYGLRTAETVLNRFLIRDEQIHQMWKEFLL